MRQLLMKCLGIIFINTVPIQARDTRLNCDTTINKNWTICRAKALNSDAKIDMPSYQL